MAKGVVRTDKMFGTDNRTGLMSVKYMGSGTTATEIQNGMVAAIDGLLTDNGVVVSREVYKAVTPAANTARAKLVLIATPDLEYCPCKSVTDFTNEAGDLARVYSLEAPDQIFSVTKDVLDGVSAPAVGDLVEAKAGTKLNVVAKATGYTANSTHVGEIIQIETVGNLTLYVIQTV